MTKQRNVKRIHNLTGQLLVSSPLMGQDSYFHKSVIYVIQHMNEGAIGVMINHPLAKQNNMFYIKSNDAPNEKPLSLDAINAFLGGPIDMEKALILHSNDYGNDRSKIAMSSNLRILKDIAQGVGPKLSMLTLGYCGWVKGQLEKEINDNLWIISQASEQLVFGTDHEEKWNIALDHLHINPFNFSTIEGHC